MGHLVVRPWGQLSCRAPREICLAISVHSFFSRDCGITLRRQAKGPFYLRVKLAPIFPRDGGPT